MTEYYQLLQAILLYNIVLEIALLMVHVIHPPFNYINVTFSVNTANITVGPNGMYAGGGVLGNAMAVPLSDPDGDGTWEGVASIADGITGNYIFLNSPSHGGDWGTKEDLTGLPCADPNKLERSDSSCNYIGYYLITLFWKLCYGWYMWCRSMFTNCSVFRGFIWCWFTSFLGENQTTGSGWVFSEKSWLYC